VPIAPVHTGRQRLPDPDARHLWSAAKPAIRDTSTELLPVTATAAVGPPLMSAAGPSGRQ
jgi:hypothetical protein